MSQKIRIKLKSYDHNLVDKSAEKIVKTVKGTGAVVSGPIPLPTQKQIFTVNRSTFVNKKAREQFQHKHGKLPEHVVACVGGGSNAMGIFTAFLDDADVRLVGSLPGGRLRMKRTACVRNRRECRAGSG